MKQPCLDDLVLTPAELEVAKKQVREMAYGKWQSAGSPDGAAEEFWADAELEWIEYVYVPNRDSL